MSEVSNFNDKPSSKVGNLGALYVKVRLMREGFKLLPPPVIYDNGGSPVDNTVVRPDGNRYYAEYITRRQKVYRGFKTYSIDSEKIERLKNLDKEVYVYVVDVSKEFGLSETEPCIKCALLSKLMENGIEKSGVYFPAEDESENSDGVEKMFTYFPIEWFSVLYYLNPTEINDLKEKFAEMDAERNMRTPTTASPMRKLNWEKDTMTAENNLFAEITSPEEDYKARLQPLGTYEAITVLRFETTQLTVYETSEKLKVIGSGDIAKAMTFTNGGLTDNKGNVYATSVLESQVDLYTTSALNAKCIRVYFDLKDVPKILNEIIANYERRGEKLSIAQQRILGTAGRFKYWYEKTVFKKTDEPKIATVAEKPVPIEKPKNPPQIITYMQLRHIVNRANQLKKHGLNGQSLDLAIKIVAEDEKFDPTAILEFKNYIEKELTTGRKVNEQNYLDGQSYKSPRA